MADARIIGFNMAECAKNITVTITVKGIRQFRFRVWLGCQIFKFGVWIIGCNYVKRAEAESIADQGTHREPREAPGK